MLSSAVLISRNSHKVILGQDYATAAEFCGFWGCCAWFLQWHFPSFPLEKLFCSSISTLPPITESGNARTEYLLLLLNRPQTGPQWINQPYQITFNSWFFKITDWNVPRTLDPNYYKMKIRYNMWMKKYLTEKSLLFPLSSGLVELCSISRLIDRGPAFGQFCNFKNFSMFAFHSSWLVECYDVMNIIAL